MLLNNTIKKQLFLMLIILAFCKIIQGQDDEWGFHVAYRAPNPSTGADSQGNDVLQADISSSSPPQDNVLASPMSNDIIKTLIPVSGAPQEPVISEIEEDLPYGGGCYVSSSGCRCDDGYRWMGDPIGPHYAGCANPSDDPKGDWCPLRQDVSCLFQATNPSFDQCGPECPPEGAPLTQCLGEPNFMTAWRCLNAIRTNPKAFEELFVNLTLSGACRYNDWKDQLYPRPAFTSHQSLLAVAQEHTKDMATEERLMLDFLDGDTFEDKALQAALTFQGYYNVRPQSSNRNVFSIIGMVANWICDDLQRETIMDCGIDTFAMGLSYSMSGKIYVSRVFTCQVLSNCKC